MTNFLAPIALFVYKRPWHTRQTVEALQQNDLAIESDLFIFSDGPKSNHDQNTVQEVREYAETITGFKRITIIKRSQNLGLAQSVISGVTELIKKYGRVIVVEDDLTTSRFFLRFMNEALNRYENEPRVMHVSGYMYPVKEVESLPESFFYRETHCWGWCTWQRAWDAFESDPVKLYQTIKERKLEDNFDIQGTINYMAMLKYQISGYLDSWWIRWYASVFLKNGLSLYPGHSLVHNIGNDGTGVHTGRTHDYDVSLANKSVQYLPDIIDESETSVQAIMNYYRSLKRPLLKRLVWFCVQVIKKLQSRMPKKKISHYC